MIVIDITDVIEKINFDAYDDLKEIGGVYAFYNGEIPVYVGKCQNIKTRIYEHKLGITNTNRIFSSFEYVKYFYEECPMKRDMYETYLINTLQPLYNLSKCFLYNPKYKYFPKLKDSVKPRREFTAHDNKRCNHIKNDGTQCKNSISENGYCGIHKRKHKNVS